MADKQNISPQNAATDPLTIWGATRGRGFVPTPMNPAWQEALHNSGLQGEARTIMDNLGNESYDASYAKMQALRDKTAAGDSPKLSLAQKQQLGSELQYIDHAMNEIRRQQQRAAENEAFNLQKNAYERAVAQNQIDGTPITVKDPGSLLWRDVEDVGGQIWHGIKKVTPGTDEFGNTEKFERPDENLAYIQQMYSGKQPAQATEATPAQATTTTSSTQGTPITTSGTAANNQPLLTVASPVPQVVNDVVTSVPQIQPSQTTPAVQQVIPAQATQPVYQRPAEPPVQIGANGYPIYERLPNGGYRYDTTYLDPQGKVDPYAMPNGIRGDFGDQEAYWNLRNRATAAKARYEQSRAADLQGEAIAGLMQVQADPETHRLAQEYMQSGMALNAQEALNLATVEQAQRMGIWGAAANAYAPMQQGLDNAQTRNTAAGAYYGADMPSMVSANGYGARTGLNGVTFNRDTGTMNVVGPNGQVITGVDPNRVMAEVAGGSPQAAAAARLNAATAINKYLNGSYGWTGAPTNAAIMAVAAQESNAAKKATSKPDKPTSVYANE